MGFEDFTRSHHSTSIAPKDHAGLVRDLNTSLGIDRGQQGSEFEIISKRAVSRRVKDFWLGFIPRTVVRKVEKLEKKPAELFSDAMSVRIRPLRKSQEDQAFVPHFGERSGGTMYIYPGAPNVKDATHNVYDPEKTSAIHPVHDFLGISSDLADHLRNKALQDGADHDVTVVRFIVKEPGQTAKYLELDTRQAQELHERQLIDYLHRHLPTRIKTAIRQGQAEIDLHQDELSGGGSRTVAVIRTRPVKSPKSGQTQLLISNPVGETRSIPARRPPRDRLHAAGAVAAQKQGPIPPQPPKRPLPLSRKNSFLQRVRDFFGF